MMINKKSQKFKISPTEKKKYVLPTSQDLEILKSCKKLEKFKLSGEDKILVKIIKTQLENNWRIHLIKTLNKILKKYKK